MKDLEISETAHVSSLGTLEGLDVSNPRQVSDLFVHKRRGLCWGQLRVLKMVDYKGFVGFVTTQGDSDE